MNSGIRQPWRLTVVTCQVTGELLRYLGYELLEGPKIMCRNIKILFNFQPPATDDEVRAAALQFVRKITGFNKPSKTNEASFLAAVEEVTMVSRRLLYSLETTAAPKNREEEAAKAKARAMQRYGT